MLWCWLRTMSCKTRKNSAMLLQWLCHWLKREKLVTFGITPLAPHIGYGYIERGDEAGSGYRVKNFKEKPLAAVAQGYLDSGDYYWNSGMFYVQSQPLFGRAFAEPSAGYCFGLQSRDGVKGAGFGFHAGRAVSLCAVSVESIDYAVMEKTSDAVVVPMNAGWSDIGSWSALSS